MRAATDEDDFRVPDRGLPRPEVARDWCPTAALVVEIVSPGNGTPAKIPLYASHGVDDLVIGDPKTHTVEWLARVQGRYQPIERSRMIPLGPAEFAARIDWPIVGRPGR